MCKISHIKPLNVFLMFAKMCYTSQLSNSCSRMKSRHLRKWPHTSRSENTLSHWELWPRRGFLKLNQCPFDCLLFGKSETFLDHRVLIHTKCNRQFTSRSDSHTTVCIRLKGLLANQSLTRVGSFCENTSKYKSGYLPASVLFCVCDALHFNLGCLNLNGRFIPRF